MRALALGLAVLLGGCSMSAGMCDAFGPEKSASMAIPLGTSAGQVFACIDEAMGDEEGAYAASRHHAIRDVQAGLLETADYGTPNVAGFRLRARIAGNQASTLDLSLRGAGAYCADLGVDREMARLTEEISRCLRR